jgi:hypothetical protein
MAGNAAVTLYGKNGLTTYDIWIQTFSTSSINEFVTQQTRDALRWTPVRRSQVSVTFTAIWPLISSPNGNNTNLAGFEGIDPSDGFGRMNAFQDAIFTHQKALVNGSTTSPMTLNYYNNSDKASPIYNEIISAEPLSPLIYTGWILSEEKQYMRFQNVFTTQYTMYITTDTSQPVVSSMDPAYNFTYAPTAQDQLNYGASWLNVNYLAQGTSQIMNGIPQE